MCLCSSRQGSYHETTRTNRGARVSTGCRYAGITCRCSLRMGSHGLSFDDSIHGKVPFVFTTVDLASMLVSFLVVEATDGGTMEPTTEDKKKNSWKKQTRNHQRRKSKTLLSVCTARRLFFVINVRSMMPCPRPFASYRWLADPVLATNASRVVDRTVAI